MDKEQSERFFSNVNWFNGFFSDLKALFDKITSNLEGYDKKLFYYQKSMDKPSIPPLYFALLGGEGLLNLNIAFIFDRGYITSKYISIIDPSILVVLHSYEKHDTTWVTRNILDGKNVTETTEEDGLISGTIDWGKNYSLIKFYSFLVPLERFFEYKDQTVKDLIVQRVNQIIEKHDMELS